MKILLITGSYPPDKCAMGDTTVIMENLFKKNGHNVKVLTHVSWKLNNLFKLKRYVDNINADILVMHYPTLGYKFSIVPQLFSIYYKNKILTIIHEVSQSFILRKISLFPFSLGSNLVFTNIYERNYFLKIFPWTLPNKVNIIPIGSNIEIYTNKKFEHRSKSNIVYFGQIRPKKGIEEVMALAALIKSNQLPFSVLIVGRKLETSADYFTSIIKASRDLPILFEIDISELEVSKILGSNMMAYLPFPDGASERRGTLFAALAHKMIVFTNKGFQTPVELDSCVSYINNPMNFIEFLTSQNSIKNLIKIENTRSHEIEKFIAKYNWDIIISQYINLFYSILILRK